MKTTLVMANFDARLTIVMKFNLGGRNELAENTEGLMMFAFSEEGPDLSGDRRLKI